MASPTAFAKIHFFRSPLSLDDIAEDVDNFLMNATATATALGAPANIINQLNGFKGKVHSQFAKSTDQLTLLKRKMTKLERVKRVAPIVPIIVAGAAAGASVISLGLGISSMSRNTSEELLDGQEPCTT